MTVVETREQPTLPARGSTPSASSWRRRALVGVLFAAVLVVMLRPGWHTLSATYPNLGDDVFLTWSISWTGHALVSNPLHLFDANIFWPHSDTLAYADNLMVLLPPFALVRGLGGSWALAMNVVTLGLLLLSLAATYSLTRWLTSRTDASILAAIAYTFGGFTFAHLGHTQLLLLGFFPLAFLLLFRFLERPTIGAAVLVGLAHIAIAMGSLYYVAIYGLSAVVILIGWVIVRRRLGIDLVRGLVVIGAISLLGIPFLYPYYELGLERPLEPRLRLQPEDFVTPAPGSFLYPGLDERASGDTTRIEHTFFPGFATLALAAVGLAMLGVSLARRSAATRDETITPAGVRADRQVFLALLAVAGAISVLVAIGPQAHGITMPFSYLHDHAPGFAGIRATSRLAVPGLLAIAVLAGTGFASVTRRWRSGVNAALATAVGAFLLLELAVPLVHTTLPTGRSTLAVYHALTKKPDAAVVELPVIDIANGADWAYVEAPRMLYSSIDWRPRFNGYSGGFPDGYLTQRATLNTFPSPAALRTMRRLKIRYAVLHVGPYNGVAQYSKRQVAAMLDRLPEGPRAERHGDAWLVDLGASYR
jgi:hypothetical protein